MPERPRAALREAAGRSLWLRAAWPAVLVALLALGLRYGVVEPSGIAHRCEPAPWTGWCAARSALVQLFVAERIGWLALACAVPALLLRLRPLARAALSLSAAGLVLYSVEPAAAAAVASLLVLARR